MLRRFNLGIILSIFTFCAVTTGCLPTQTIIVRFEDLKSDLVALESSLQAGDWATFDWDKMEIIISSQHLQSKPVALGSFQLSQSRGVTPTRERAAADQPELDLKSIQMSDTISKLMRRRQARLTAINAMKANGFVGESNVGMLLPPGGAEALATEQRELTDGENVDRRLLLHEILRQKNLGTDKYDNVAKTFAEVQRQVAGRGVWVQYPDNSWEKIK